MRLAFRLALGTFLQVLGNFVHPLELPWPLVVVQELAVVKSVVIGGVVLSMVGWCDGCGLVAIHGVIPADTTASIAT